LTFVTSIEGKALRSSFRLAAVESRLKASFRPNSREMPAISVVEQILSRGDFLALGGGVTDASADRLTGAPRKLVCRVAFLNTVPHRDGHHSAAGAG
jgi:hypothetical protein